MEYAQIKGDLKTVDLKVLNEIEAVFEEELGYTIPPRTPFVGKEFNVTKAGIHADGLLKNEEIYNSFDTNKLLGRPALIEINTYSGLAGLAYWMNCYYNLTGNDKIVSMMIDCRSSKIKSTRNIAAAERPTSAKPS